MIALFVALGGTAGAAGIKLITGADIRDESITGVDIRRGSVTGLNIRDGSLGVNDFSPVDLGQLVGPEGDTGPKGDTGATGPQGPPGAPATLESVDSTGVDISNYQDGDPIVTVNAPAAGYYIAIASGTVTNTGASDDYLNCGFDVSGAISGAAGYSTTAGNTSSGISVTVAATATPTRR